MTDRSERPGIRPELAAWLSIGLSVAVLGVKYLAYRVTGSVSLYSDALESSINVVAGVAALLAIRVSTRPPDLDHPFGHTKAEYISAVVEGVLILLAALEIVRAAWERISAPTGLTDLGLGLTLSLLATAVNAGLARFLIWNGRKTRSPALVADGRHLWADVLTTVGVLVGIGLAWLSGWWLLDPLLAVLVAVNILRVGLRIVFESVGGLMDRSPSSDDMHRIHAVILANMRGALEVHDLRSRHAGRYTFIEFHLVVPASMTVLDAHGICDRIEAALREDLPGSDILIHVEPEDKAQHRGRVTRIGF